MLTKKVDATLGGFWNYEGLQLRLEKKHPEIIRVDGPACRPTTSSCSSPASPSCATTARSCGASSRRWRSGHKKLRSDPAAGVKPLLEANKDLDPKLQLAAVKATLPVFFPEDERRPFGWQDPRQWEAYGKWMLDNDLVTQLPAPGSLTNEFLPGEGV